MNSGDNATKHGTSSNSLLRNKDCGKSDTESILGTLRPGRRIPTASIIANMKPKNESVLKHKTKVRQVQPPSRLLYVWEWEVCKFDRSFPLLMSGVEMGGVEMGGSGVTRTVKSAKITAGKDMGKKSDWYFVLSEKNGFLSWYLELKKIHKGAAPLIHGAFSIKVMDVEGKELLVTSRCFRDFRENFQFGFDDIIGLEKLYAQKDLYLCDNTLRIQVTVEMFSDACQKYEQELQTEKFAKIVTTDLNRLRSATGTADVHLDCGGRAFPAHKLILAARSSAFARMFDTLGHSKANYRSPVAGGDNPPEQTISTVAITDVEPQILEFVLDYIYSANVKPLANQEILSGLVRAADKFELRDLKSYCFDALMNFVNEDSIGNLAVLAFRHNADRNVRMNINGYCLRNLVSLMKKKSFRDALRSEPDAFFPDADE